MDKLGDEAHAAAITVEGLWKRYQVCSPVLRWGLYYYGSAGEERVAAALNQCAGRSAQSGGAGRAGVRGADRRCRRCAAAFHRVYGCDSRQAGPGVPDGGGCIWSEDYPALLVCNAVYGGTPTSKLFSMSGRSCPCAILQAPCWKSLKVS